jgi:hypothetical protein
MALLWAPTQGDPLNWDASIGLPNHRYFVFEYKAVEDDPYPYVQLNIDQLKTYQDLNDALGDTVVWYILPCWTGPNVSGTFLPAVARLRTLRSRDPRPVGSAPNPPGALPNMPLTREEHVLGRGCEAYFYVGDPRTMLESGTFRTNVNTASLRVENVPAAARGMTLEHFAHLVDQASIGVTWEDQLHRHIEDPRLEVGGPSRGRNTMAFAVPSSGINLSLQGLE